MANEDRLMKSSRPTIPFPEPPSPAVKRALDYYFDPSHHGSSTPTFPAVLFEWHKQGKKRQELSCARSVRDVLQPQPQPLADAAVSSRQKRLVIVRSCDQDVRGVLEGVGGVEKKFLDAHGRKAAYRGKVGSVRRGLWWEIPERRGNGYNFRRVSLWIGEVASIIVLDMMEQKPLRRSHLKLHHHHQQQHHSFRRSSSDDFSVEDDIWDHLGPDVSIQDILADAAWHRWQALAHNMNRIPQAILTQALYSLEAQLLSNSRQNPSFSQDDILALIKTTHRRIQSSPPPPNPTASQPPSGKNENERGLDRIAYLGGVLFPLTVVSGVLSINGPYGPGGGAFWVFWVASGVCCLLATLVIYLDQVRRMQVWIQVAVDDLIEGGDDDDTDDRDERNGGKDVEIGIMRMAAVADVDADARVWTKKELGWGGAVKKVSGWYRVKGKGAGLRFQHPEEERGR